jgi:hypothetical protein
MIFTDREPITDTAGDTGKKFSPARRLFDEVSGTTPGVFEIFNKEVL